MGLYRRLDSPYWWYRFQKKGIGRIERSTNEKDKKKAQIVAAGERSKFYNGDYFGQPDRPEFKKYILAYLKTVRHEPGFKTKERVLTHYLKVFEKLTYLDELTPPIIREHIADLLDRLQANSVNRTLSPLRAVCTRAFKDGQLEKNPFDGIASFNEEEFSRERFLSNGERPLLLSNLFGQMLDIVIFAMQTGLRKGEIMNLRWGDIDFESGLILVRAGREDKNRRVPMALGPNVKFILSHRPRMGEFVFCNEDGSKLDPNGFMRYQFEKACKDAGVADFNFHDLRHTFITDLIRVERNWKKIAKWVGHSTTYMTEKYAHVMPEDEQVPLPVLPPAKFHYAGNDVEMTVFKSA